MANPKFANVRITSTTMRGLCAWVDGAMLGSVTVDNDGNVRVLIPHQCLHEMRMPKSEILFEGREDRGEGNLTHAGDCIAPDS